jgi:hypothetical protein
MGEVMNEIISLRTDAGPPPQHAPDPAYLQHLRDANGREYSGNVLFSSGVISVFLTGSLGGGFLYLPIFAAILLGMWRLCHKYPSGLDEALPLAFLGATTLLGYLASEVMAAILRVFAERLYLWSPDIAIGGAAAVATFVAATIWIRVSERRTQRVVW